MEMITREMIDPVVASHEGNRLFEERLRAAGDPPLFVRVLGRYIAFNAVFGGGVANLAGEIATRQDLFQDRTEPVRAVRDRSSEIASMVFAAAIDEFDDRKMPHLDTHRMLAQATLKATADFYGFSPAQVDKLVTPNEGLLRAIMGVLDGYAVHRAPADWDLLQGIGFHMGSEILADAEFNILDAFMKEDRPDLVAYLEKTSVPLSGNEHNAYYWVFIHTSVEADHFEHAAHAANRALEFYAGPRSREEACNDILRGFRRFGEVQADLMKTLLD